MQPVDPFHQLADRIDDRAELNADRPVLARRLDDDREVQVVGEVETAAVRPGEHGRMHAVKLEDLLRDGLVLRHHQAVGARSRVSLANQLEKSRNLEIGRIIAGKRLGEIEHQVAFHPRQRQ